MANAVCNIYDEYGNKSITLDSGLPKILGYCSFDPKTDPWERPDFSQYGSNVSSIMTGCELDIYVKELIGVEFQNFFSFNYIINTVKTVQYTSTPRLSFKKATGRLTYSFTVYKRYPENIDAVWTVFGIY